MKDRASFGHLEEALPVEAGLDQPGWEVRMVE